MNGLILGLDIATTTGFAHDLPGDAGIPAVGSLKLPSGTGGAHGAGFYAFAQWLDNIVLAKRPVLVAMEAPMHVAGGHASSRPTQQNTIRVLMGLAAIAEYVCFARRTTLLEINIGTAKKYLAGNGRADKAAMMHACKIRGWPVTDDHQADAIALWAYAKASRDPKWSPKSTALFARAQSSGITPDK